MRTKTKTKPPIDRENATDVAPTPPAPANDVVFPQGEAAPAEAPARYQFTPAADVTVKEVLEITMMLIFQLTGAEPPAAGALSSLALSEPYLQALHERTVRHFEKLAA